MRGCGGGGQGSGGAGGHDRGGGGGLLGALGGEGRGAVARPRRLLWKSVVERCGEEGTSRLLLRPGTSRHGEPSVDRVPIDGDKINQ